MKKYTIKSGDTLGSIAFKQLGSTGRWREIAELNNLANPNSIKVGQILLLPNVNESHPSTKDSDVIIIEENDKIYYQYQNDPTKRYLGKKFKKGIFRNGNQNTETFIQGNPTLLSEHKISTSEVNALLATSENEGNLDAINTWDNSFLSFGMFQWTMGAKGDEGELASLLKLINEKYPKVFNRFWGQFGLAISISTNKVNGYFLYKNKKVDTIAEKKLFRSNIMAYRFVSAGMEKEVNAIQVLHAIKRFDRFYFVKSSKLGGNTLYDLLSSEYAAALFLDNHVNRPGYLLSCVGEAIEESGLSYDEIKNGGDTIELQIINRYLKIRETYGRHPMTNAKARAVVTKRYLDEKKISAKKGSFISNHKLRE